MKEDLLKIINHYGINNQQRKLNEEIFELQEQISIYEQVHDWDSNGFFMAIVPDEEKIIEEMSDCYVVLEQLRLYYDIPTEQIKEMMEYKVKRQIERISKE